MKGGKVMQNVEENYSKYFKIVYKYIFCLTGNKELSEEIVQEAFLVAVKDINKFEGKSKITTWLCQIAKNIWYKQLKKEKGIKKISLSEIENIAVESFEEKLYEKDEKLQWLKKIQKLKRKRIKIVQKIDKELYNLGYNIKYIGTNYLSDAIYLLYFLKNKKILN